MSGILRAPLDVGLLSNVRMGAEIATALAFLSGRRLSLPFDQPVPPAPQSSIPPDQQGRSATLLDLFELPVEIVHTDEWAEIGDRPTEVFDWGDIGHAVCTIDGEVDLTDPQLVEFANGRTRFVRVPTSVSPIIETRSRLLSFYSYFFHGRPATLRRLHALIRGVRPRRAFIELGATIAAGLGPFNALHLRRSDLTIGIPAYGDVTPDDVAVNLASILPGDELLVICSEVNPADALFDPIRRRFPRIAFANDLILRDHRRGFFSLPRHEDNALGLVTQEIAIRAAGFVGTIGSTFTAMIQRQRLLRDPNERFRFTADFTPDGPVFVNGEFVDIADGSYSWNRIAYAMSPDVLAWFREWPEAA